MIINTVSVILYKRLSFNNGEIAFWTSLFYLPWVIKMLWGPLVDIYSTKHHWILFMELFIGVMMGVLALCIHWPYFFEISLVLFFLTAFLSATHDIAVDGFYLAELSKSDQALFVGVRSFFYRVSMIFGSGILVYIAGKLEKHFGNIEIGWSMIFIFLAVVFLVVYFYHQLILPQGTSRDLEDGIMTYNQKSFFEIIISFFKRKKIIAILLFILLYRLGEAMLVKMVVPFLLDKTEQGGLGLATEDVGLLYGTFSVLALMLGGFLGGWLISRYNLKKCFWPFILALNLPDLLYVYMSYQHPPLFWIYGIVMVEQFGYGLGFSAFMVYLMRVSQGTFQTSYYAICTGFMALGMMFPGMISGFLQQCVGYPLFFVLVCLLTIPGMLMLFFIPWDEP